MMAATALTIAVMAMVMKMPKDFFQKGQLPRLYVGIGTNLGEGDISLSAKGNFST